MSHTTAADITAERVPEFTARLLAWFDGASWRQRGEGIDWYPVVGQLAEVIGHGDAEIGAGMIAALSPRTPWDQTVRLAGQLADGEQARTLGKNLDEARRIMAGEPWQTVLPEGSKRWNFAHNILGHDTYVTVDVWALRAALGVWDVTGVKLDTRHQAQYDMLAEAYRQAAAARGVSPSVFQSVVWVAVREAGKAGFQLAA